MVPKKVRSRQARGRSVKVSVGPSAGDDGKGNKAKVNEKWRDDDKFAAVGDIDDDVKKNRPGQRAR